MEALETTLLFDVGMIAQVILIDLALGGDNSIVIGMAAKNLPKHLQKKAILYGTGGAILLRFIMAFIVSWLFHVPFLKTVGGLLLVCIGIKLIGAPEDEEDVHVEAKETLWPAVRTIMLADALMSLDNVLAIVGVTDNHWGLLMLGMLISVPIIVFGSQRSWRLACVLRWHCNWCCDVPLGSACRYAWTWNLPCNQHIPHSWHWSHSRPCHFKDNEGTEQ